MTQHDTLYILEEANTAMNGLDILSAFQIYWQSSLSIWLFPRALMQP